MAMLLLHREGRKFCFLIVMRNFSFPLWWVFVGPGNVHVCRTVLGARRGKCLCGLCMKSRLSLFGSSIRDPIARSSAGRHPTLFPNEQQSVLPNVLNYGREFIVSLKKIPIPSRYGLPLSSPNSQSAAMFAGEITYISSQPRPCRKREAGTTIELRSWDDIQRRAAMHKGSREGFTSAESLAGQDGHRQQSGSTTPVR